MICRFFLSCLHLGGAKLFQYFGRQTIWIRDLQLFLERKKSWLEKSQSLKLPSATRAFGSRIEAFRYKEPSLGWWHSWQSGRFGVLTPVIRGSNPDIGKNFMNIVNCIAMYCRKDENKLKKRPREARLKKEHSLNCTGRPQYNLGFALQNSVIGI